MIEGFVAVAVALVSIVLVYYQQVTAQEQHFQDCKQKMIDFTLRQSRLIDRIGIEGRSNDLRLQYSTLMNEGNILFDGCRDVADKLAADETLQVQSQGISNQLARYGITPQP